MQIPKISQIYSPQTNSLSMCGKREDNAAIKNFKKYMSDNDLVLTAEIVPMNGYSDPFVKGVLGTYHFYSKENPQSRPLIKRNVHGVNKSVEAIGNSVDDVLLKIIKFAQGGKLSVLGEADYVLNVPVLQQ